MAYTLPTATSVARFRGDTEALTLKLVDSAGSAIDITGYTFKLTISSSKAPVDTSDQLAQEIGSITNAVGGEVTFPVSPTVGGAGTLAAGTFFWDAQYTTPGGAVRTFAHGTWAVSQDITK